MGPVARQRPAVSVVVPFLGDVSAAATAIRNLTAIERGSEDELIVVDNSPGGDALSLDGTDGVRVIAATVKRSAYAARNEGAELARSDWLLFVDADCRPRPTILDDYFAQPIDSSCGAVAGEIVGAAEQESAAARWTRSHGLLSSEVNRRFPYRPMAPTANLLVRRQTYSDLGGFPEGMTAAAGDVYFSWRLQEAGWKLCFRPSAVVEHLHRETVAALLRQTARDAAGNAWLNRLYPGTLPLPSLFAGLGRSVSGTIVFALTGRFERSQMNLIYGLVVIAQAVGYRLGHGAAGGPPPKPVEATVAAEFPRRGDRAISLAQGPAASGWIEAVSRARDPDWKSARGIEVRFWEDDGTLRRLTDTLWLLVRHPGRVIADRRFRLAATRPAARMPLQRLAPAARRISAVRGMRLAATGDPLAEELARTARRPERRLGDRRPVADRPPQHRCHLDQVVEHEVGDQEKRRCRTRRPGGRVAPSPRASARRTSAAAG